MAFDGSEKPDPRVQSLVEQNDRILAEFEKMVALSSVMCDCTVSRSRMIMEGPVRQFRELVRAMLNEVET